ncbi:hypothetical protein IL306_011174 [Fusarium sp. DS 682]|nr:hypothetical protein IL306_011174 [Fusarium sp. DS 682]
MPDKHKIEPQSRNPRSRWKSTPRTGHSEAKADSSSPDTLSKPRSTSNDLAHSYCADMKVGEWKAMLENLDRGTTQDFLYICERCKITSWGSGHEYIRHFQQLYTTVNGQYMDRNDTKEVYKPVLNVDNLQVILTFNIAYDTTVFPGERHRINLAGCYQLLCYTGARPAELVDGERQKPKDGSIQELFGQNAVQSSSSASSEEQETPADE